VFGLPILDIAIGLIFMYLLLALICTAANEFIAGVIHARAKNLEMGIRDLLEHPEGAAGVPAHLAGKKLPELFYQHPLIKSLRENGRLPSYIPSRTFALALLDIIDPASPEGSHEIADLRKAVAQLPESWDVRRSLLVLLNEGENDIKKMREHVEAWFDNAMDRVSGWYKRKTQVIVFLLAVAATLITNADTIRMAQVLSNNPAMREALVAQAQVYAKQADSERDGAKTRNPADRVRDNIEETQKLGIPLGWKSFPDSVGRFLSMLCGLLLTSFAVSLGAPFWFDMLNKVINIRASGKSPRDLEKLPEAPAKLDEEKPPK
jgi:hypothetical protein